MDQNVGYVHDRRTYLLVGDALGAYEAVHHGRVKLSSSRNLRQKRRFSSDSASQLTFCCLCTLKWMWIISKEWSMTKLWLISWDGIWPSWCGPAAGCPCRHRSCGRQAVLSVPPAVPQGQWYPATTETETHCRAAAVAAPSCGCGWPSWKR